MRIKTLSFKNQKPRFKNQLFKSLSRSVVLSFVACLLVFSISLSAAAEEAEDPGQTVFLAQKCNLCHSIESLGIEKRSKSESAATQGSDLSTVGDRHDGEWIAAFLNKEVDLDGEKHKKGFRGTDEELQALLDWLTSLKAEEEDAAAEDSGSR